MILVTNMLESKNEVLRAPPVSNIPKQILKAPPLDTANPTQAHSYLPVPSSSAKLKSGGTTSSSGTPTAPSNFAAQPSTAAHTTPGPQIFGRFPPESKNLSEEELDPYFVSFETSSKELENLLQGSMEKVNKRTLSHLSALGEDLAELGAKFNQFSLSEQSQSLAGAIEKTGQAVDSTYIATAELSHSLSASFAEPMRESAQFAGVVRSVLRYRVMKRIQEEMTKDELQRKRALLESLEHSEAEAKRLEQHLSGTGYSQPARNRSVSNSSQRSSGHDRRAEEDTASIDSDFPPTHSEVPSSSQGSPESSAISPTGAHKKSPSGNFVTNKLFGPITHAFRGMADVDPERTRRDQIGKTRESLHQLEQAVVVAEKDTKDASSGVLKDLHRFQNEKENDLRRYMVSTTPVPLSLSFLRLYIRVTLLLIECHRSNSHNVTSTGQSGTRLHGRKRKPKLATSNHTSSRTSSASFWKACLGGWTPKGVKWTLERNEPWELEGDMTAFAQLSLYPIDGVVIILRMRMIGLRFWMSNCAGVSSCEGCLDVSCHDRMCVTSYMNGDVLCSKSYSCYPPHGHSPFQPVKMQKEKKRSSGYHMQTSSIPQKSRKNATLPKKNRAFPRSPYLREEKKKKGDVKITATKHSSSSRDYSAPAQTCPRPRPPARETPCGHCSSGARTPSPD